MLAFDSMVPALHGGIIASALISRLRATAQGLDGTLESAPDLAIHLPGLRSEARRGLSVPDFAVWLHARADALEAGVVEPELLTWLDEQLLPALHNDEAESLRWLEGVVDHRYAIAQAEAASAFVDQCVAELLECLRLEGLYEDCTALFVGTHIELDGDQGHRAHHRALTEGNIQIPLVYKPRRGVLEETAASILEGPFEIVDVLPTVLDGLGLPVPEVDGTSRWPNISTGARIADRATFAVGYDATEVAVTSDGYKLVKVLEPDAYGQPAGSVRLFELTPDGDVPSTNQMIEKELVARLDEWLLSTS
jgi:hypothetical protein